MQPSAVLVLNSSSKMNQQYSSDVKMTPKAFEYDFELSFEIFPSNI